MSCGALERWIENGMPEEGCTAVRAHAAGCPLCGPRLEAAEQVEALLQAPAPAAPAGFADRVLRRVAAEPRPRRAPARSPAPARRLPWWSWIGADPALPIALAVGSVLLGLVQVGAVLVEQPFHLPLPSMDMSRIGAVFESPSLRAVGVALAFLIPLLLLSYALYQAAQGVVRPSARRR